MKVELTSCPVRKRFLYQIARYGLQVRRWQRELESGSSGHLSALLARAETTTSYYPEAFARAGVHWRDLRSTSDLAHFPSLPRTTAQARYFDSFSHDLAPHDVEEGWLGTSSGSTGEPVRFFMDGASIHFFSSFLRFLWRRLVGEPLPRPGRTGVVLLCTLPRSSIYQTWLPLFSVTRFRKLHWYEPDAEPTLTRLNPAVITGDPDSLMRLAEASESGAVSVRPKLILSSAFALPEATRLRLERATRAVVIDYYSMAETGPLAWRCRQNTFHVLDAVCQLETVAGEVLVTNLRNRHFPLVRYHTGDLGEVDEGHCACGVRGSQLGALSGRVTSRFVGARGERVDPSQLQPLLSRLALSQFQLVQRDADRVVLRYHAEAPLVARATKDVEAALARLLAAPVVLEREHQSEPLFRPGEKPLVYRTLLAG